MSSRCRTIEVIERLKSRLDAQNIRRFKGTCFGRFIDLPPLIFQGKLIEMLLKYVVDERARLILKFKLKNVVANFSREEFFMLTGLGFGKTKENKKRSELHETVFGGSKSIFMVTIERAFERECEATRGGSEIALKLGLLLFVYGCLLGGSDSYSAPLDIAYIHVVDDIGSIGSFPWGREAYNFFINQFYTAYDKWMSSLRWKRTDVIDVNGLNLVMQWWLYETFPVIGAKFCDLVDKHTEKWPRMLRWWSSEMPYNSPFAGHVDLQGDIMHVRFYSSVRFEHVKWLDCTLQT